MYAGRCELNVPTSGTRDRRLRGYLVSFARCPRVETDLAAAVSLFHFEFRSIDFLYNFPCQSIRLTQTESQRPDGGLIRNLGARALLLMRGQASALEPLRTSRRGHQQRTTRVSLARIVQQRRAHEPAHGPLESGARHSRDLRGGPRDRGYLQCAFMSLVEPSRMLSSDMIQRVCEG